MENRSATQGNALGRVCETGGGEGIERHRIRQPGGRPGTFKSECVICQGKGCMRASGPYNVWNTCLTCGGEGTVIMDGEREGDSDRRTQPTWGDVALFSLVVAFFTAFGCALLYLYARGH